jgi:menaquinone-dependent protoporphyrinogen oxidase
MRILITWGSKRGGTEGIAHDLAETLRQSGHDVTATAAASVARLDGFDAVLVGGALYANRWARAARRFVARHEREGSRSRNPGVRRHGWWCTA